MEEWEHFCRGPLPAGGYGVSRALSNQYTETNQSDTIYPATRNKIDPPEFCVTPLSVFEHLSFDLGPLFERYSAVVSRYEHSLRGGSPPHTDSGRDSVTAPPRHLMLVTASFAPYPQPEHGHGRGGCVCHMIAVPEVSLFT